MSRLAVLMPSLTGGGAERGMLQLAAAFAADGHDVDLLLTRVKGRHGDKVPPELSRVPLRRAPPIVGRAQAMRAAGSDRFALLRPVLLPLKSSWALCYLPDLVRYLCERKPDALISANSWPNLVALWAKQLARVDTRIVVTERVQLSQRVRHLAGKWRWRHLPELIHRTYPRADWVVAVSQGVMDDLVSCAGLPQERVLAIDNPVVTPALLQQAEAPLSHPWLDPINPPLVAVGRLHPQKNFPLLLRAFARVRTQRPSARLIVLGEGAERTRLEQLARELGIADAVAFPGFVDNPYAFMSRAAALVLSSDYEGLPTVLIEGLACGVPVVSTDCPSGPAEILDHGRFGRLVPVGDEPALAAAILATLETPADRRALRQRGLDFTAEAAARRYLPLLLGTVRSTQREGAFSR